MLQIYEDALGGWIVFDGTKKHHFAGEQEARIMALKFKTAEAIATAVASLATAADNAAALEAEYFDVGPFADNDVASLGITADQLAACLTLLQQVDKLMTNQATTPAMYRSTLNLVKRTPA